MAAIGTTANQYEILSKLAEGGMAEIFLARSSVGGAANRYVVLKRIAKSRATDTNYVRMFLDEARLASQLRHPNIAQVFDIGRLGASYFFTMEYVHGVTVQMLVHAAQQTGTTLPIGAILAIVAGTAAGLEHAHERRSPTGNPLGIVHRDVSPSNLLVSYEGHLKIVDFGVAKAMGRPETQAGEIKGKVGYLSPEQCRMHKIDRRSDLYSLGVVMWEMLTLERLWLRDSAFGTLAAIATEVPPPPSKLRPDIPVEVDELVRQMLTLDPDQRFQTAQTVSDAIEQVAQRTKTSTSSQQLARVMRDLFGSPPEPWHALEAQHEFVNVIATPVPSEEVLASFDHEPSVSEVEVKLTSVFRAVTDDFSSTNVLATRAPPAEDETREVMALAHAPAVDSHTPTPLPAPPVAAPHHVTMRAPAEPPPPDVQLAQSVAPDPAQTILGTMEPPRRLSPASIPPPGSGPYAPPGSGPYGMINPSAPPGSGPYAPPLPRASGPINPSINPAIPVTAPVDVRPSGKPVINPSAMTPGDIRPSAAQIAPTAMHVLPDSGPRPIAPAAMHVMPDSGPRPMPADSGGALIALPRYPPPPHGDMRLLRWFVLGGLVVGAGLVALVLLLGSDSSTNDPPSSDAAVVIVATKPDAGAIASDGGAPADATAAVDASAIDAAAPADAAPAIDAAPPDPKLRSKPELNAAFREKRYKDIVAACVAYGAEDERAVVCTLAACRAHDPKAQDWFRNVAPKQRKGTIQICKDSGDPITDVCASDPSSCRK